MDTNKKEKMISLRLTKQALSIMEEKAQELGVSKTSVVEMALRKISSGKELEK